MSYHLAGVAFYFISFVPFLSFSHCPLPILQFYLFNLINMLTKIKLFIKTRKQDIVLVLFVLLCCFFCFALGYIWGFKHQKEPIIFEQNLTF